MAIIYTNVRKSKQKKKPGWKEREAEHLKYLKKMGIDPNSKKKPKKFVPLKPTTPVRRDDNRDKYVSLMEKEVAEGTFCSGSANSCAKQESQRYTGTLIKGIATMHKSNAVPVIDEQQAKDIARMRR